MKGNKIIKSLLISIIVMVVLILPSKTFAATKVKKVTEVVAKTITTSSIEIKWNKVSGISGYEVSMATSKDGKFKKVTTIKKAKTIKYKKTKLTAGKNYYFKVRTYKASKGTKKYSSYSKVLQTATKPKAPKISKITSGNKKVTIKWNKVSGASGYEVSMATSKNGKYKKVATIKKGTTISYTKTGLKDSRTYYFKVRAYKTVNGKKIYSSYSAKKNVKTKKASNELKVGKYKLKYGTYVSDVTGLENLYGTIILRADGTFHIKSNCEGNYPYPKLDCDGTYKVGRVLNSFEYEDALKFTTSTGVKFSLSVTNNNSLSDQWHGYSYIDN